MLSREICQKCWGNGWGVEDDSRWNAPGAPVFCCAGSETETTLLINRRAPPPARCPYKMEHGMSEALVRQ